MTPLTTFTPDMNGMSNGNPIANMHLDGVVTSFDPDGHPVETTDNSGVGENVYNACIIDCEESNQVIAEASNAKIKEISYTSFETPWPIFYANCEYFAEGVSSEYSLLGRYSYQLSDINDPFADYHPFDFFNIDLGPTSSPTEFILSYWAQPGALITIDDGSGTPMTASPTITRDGWTLYKLTFTPATSSIALKGIGYIDEVKLHPVRSLMKTHTFLPLLGKCADVDVNDNYTTYEYDGFGNLTIVRDQDKNIISKTEIHTQN